MRLRKVDFRLVTALVLLLAAAGVVATRVTAFRKQVLDPASSSGLTRRDPAPEFTGIAAWLNSAPLTMLQLRGKVVLIDFWTYSCVNCIRTLPELRTLYGTYHAAGLEIVGVHAPEFTFEKDEANVRRAVEKNGVTWPVALDNQMDTWDAYQNQYWPHVYLVDRAGSIRFDHIGEGGAAQIEAAIRTLLGSKAPSAVALPTYAVPDEITPEIYLGYGRGEAGGFLGNRDGYVHDREAAYRVPSPLPGAGSQTAFWLGGSWIAREQFIVAAAARATIVLPFKAANVFVVAGAGDEERTAKVTVTLDGKPIPPSVAASAVHGDALEIGAKDLYPVVRLRGVESHTLTLTTSDAGPQFYTFTFG